MEGTNVAQPVLGPTRCSKIDGITHLQVLLRVSTPPKVEEQVLLNQPPHLSAYCNGLKGHYASRRYPRDWQQHCPQVNTQTLCLKHHEVITSSTPTTIRLVATDGQCRTHVSVIVGFHFWGAFTQRISFSTLHLKMLDCRPHWSQSSPTWIGRLLQTLLASSIIFFFLYLISALAFTRPSGCWLTAHPSTFASTLLLDNTRLQFTLNAPQQHGTFPLHIT